MPRYRRVFDPGHLQFITSSTYRRVPVLASKCFCQIFAEVLGRLRQEFGFRLVGWELMPDHFHLLIQPWGADVDAPLPALVFRDPKHRIRIYQGNCLEILPPLPAQSVDLIFANSPYFGSVYSPRDS